MRRGMIGAKKFTSEPLTGTLVRARAGHHELLEDRLVADAHPLLHVGDLGLRLRVALRRVHQGEDRARHGDHDGRRDEQLDERVARLACRRAANRARHDAFLVLTVTSSASPTIRVRVNAVWTRVASRAIGVTSTWMTSVLFGLVGSG